MIFNLHCKTKYIWGALCFAVSSALMGSVLYFSLAPYGTVVPTNAPSTATSLPSSHPSYSPSPYPTLSPSDPPTHYPSFSPTTTPTLVPTLSPTLVNLSSYFTTYTPTMAPRDDSSFYEQAPYLIVGIAIFVFTFASVYGVREYHRVCLSVSPDNATQELNAVPHAQLPSPHIHENSEEDKGVAV